jgi:hypothetical protein
VRRRMPELLIGWARLLEGRVRDPRVGRDVLIGAVIGTFLALGVHLTNAWPTWFPFAGQTTLFPNYEALLGGRYLASYLAKLPVDSLTPAMVTFSVYFLARLLLRKPAPAIAALFLFATLTNLGGENFMLETPGAVVAGILTALVVARFGLLALVTMWLFRFVFTFVPLPLDFKVPYATSSLIVMLSMIALALYAFRISLGSQRVLAIED